MDERDTDFDRAVARIWAELDRIAHVLDGDLVARARHVAAITPTSLASELQHNDGGARVRAPLRAPNDGGEPFAYRRHSHWRLTELQASRVRRHFPI